MKRAIQILLALLTLVYARAEAPKISLLTCGPTDDYVFYLYGHTAIRVQHEGQDLVFNYGYFSLDQKNFILNFIIGKPMYSLGVTTFEEFLWEYSAQGRSVVEQELALLPEEATLLYDKLQWNALPENRDYQYNFYFDNCATRPRDMIEAAVGGLKYQLPADSLPTFREAIRQKSRTAVWYTMGADICLGWKSDQQMTLRDAAFLPELLEQEMDSALRLDTGTPLVTNKVVWLEQTKQIVNRTMHCHFPLLIFIGMGLLLALFKWGRWDKLLRVSEKIIFFLLGIGGIVVWFLALFSQHPHTWPNANMLFLHPFWLILTFAHSKKKYSKTNKWLYFGNFVAIIAYLLLSFVQVLPSDLPTLAVVVAIDQWLHWRDANKLTRLNE